MRLFLPALATLSLVVAAAVTAQAAGKAPPVTVTLTLENHRFTPSTFTAPAGRTVEIVLVNRDGTPEEFDSDDLGIEEVAHPHETIRFPIGPLKPGRYAFMGEYHPKTAQGVIEVK
jgi:hypothetical protein